MRWRTGLRRVATALALGVGAGTLAVLPATPGQAEGPYTFRCQGPLAPDGQVAVPPEMAEHDLRGGAHRRPRITLEAGQGVVDLRQQGLVIGEDHVLLRPELPEEGATRHPGGRRDLLDRRRFVAVLAEQPDRLGDDEHAEARTVDIGN